ncbi:MAG: hypothetical protein ACQESH_07865 [Campylobacterota bacterium]
MEKFYEELIENDLDPFILFNSNGGVERYNKKADFLLSFVSYKEIYDLALANAPQTFGFKRTFIELEFKESYYAILVGYVDEQNLGIKLYRKNMATNHITIDEKYKLVNLYTLLELSKNSILNNIDISLHEEYDLTIPETKVNIDHFLKLLNEIFLAYSTSKELSIRSSIKLGEFIKIEGKKYQVCCLRFAAKGATTPQSVKELAKDTNFILSSKNGVCEIEFPLIVQK